MIAFVLKEGLPSLAEVGFSDFILGRRWAPGYEEYGALPLIYGSLMVVFGALAISIPLGISSAIFISEVLPPTLGEIVKSVTELLAAIPSVIYGLIGFQFLAPWIATTFGISSGECALTGSVVLSIMVLPTIVSISGETMVAVPREYREASLAMGATRWQNIREIILPVSRSGVVTSIVLAFGRAIGETVAVLMICGNAGLIPSPPWNFLDPVYTMTAAIAMYMGEAAVGSTHYHVLFGLGLLLFLITFVTNSAAHILLRRAARRVRGGG